MLEGLDTDLRNFQKLLFEGTPMRSPSATSARGKRGLIDILWYGMKYLFGTADANDVNRLAKVCDELHAFESRVMHAVNHQLTYIRKLDEMNRQNMKDTVELARTLRDSFRNLSLQMNRVEADLLDTQAAIEKQARYSAAIREI
jgi:septal ring factor EnvC (AmiA/AmiB activator)